MVVRRLVGFATWAVLTGCADDGSVGTDASGPTESSEVGSSSSVGPGSTTATTSTDSGSVESSSGGPAPFELVVRTIVTPEGRLALEANLPAWLDDCLALGLQDAPCDDADLDDLTDAWEDIVLERLRPMRRLDENEMMVGDPDAAIGDVGRVVAVPDDRYRLFVMLGYSRDYGSCGGFTAHNGDSERVVVNLAPYPEGDVGGVVFAGAYTAAHEGTINDHGRLFVGDELAELVIEDDPRLAEPRWIVYPSANKHATYANKDICEGISPVPCVDEDCAPDGAMDPSAFDVLPDAVNAGEEPAPRATDLSQVGFPGEQAWVDQEFCGGLGGSPCSSSVLEKLSDDPFGA